MPIPRNEWLDASIALPPIDERVLIYSGESWHVGRLSIDSHFGADWQVNACGCWARIEGVTHWMRPQSIDQTRGTSR